MRFIKKIGSPIFLEEEKRNLTNDSSWKDLHCKNLLRSHLVNEQDRLCIYCERRIDEKNSHIEHIYAQSNDANLRFEYVNLVASCNGDQCEEFSKDIFRPEDVNSCGHKKSNDMNKELFLNPISEHNIDECFSYNNENCTIHPSDKDPNKASYTINLLGLNNTRLNNERSNARYALIKALKSRPLNKKVLLILLSKNPPFVSFLRYYYSPFLKK
jgi:uncharacterized protein (TIGR02646 family)